MPTYDAPGDRADQDEGDGGPVVALRYDERGDGDPVVVLGGGPARHPDYLGDLGGLGERFRLVVPHLRGIGGSPLPEDPRQASWWQQAADVEALRRHLGLERLTVLGHSAGSRIATAFAARFPDSLERLVLVTPPVGDAAVEAESDVPAIRARRDGDPDFQAALRTAQQGPPQDADDEALTAWQRRIGPLSYARWERPQQAHAAVGGWSPAAVAAYDTVGAPDGFPQDLARLPVPVTVIAAAEDGIVGTAGPAALAGIFPAGRLLRIDGAGHYPWVDRPSELVDAATAALTA